MEVIPSRERVAPIDAVILREHRMQIKQLRTVLEVLQTTVMSTVGSISEVEIYTSRVKSLIRASLAAVFVSGRNVVSLGDQCVLGDAFVREEENNSERSRVAILADILDPERRWANYPKTGLKMLSILKIQYITRL